VRGYDEPNVERKNPRWRDWENSDAPSYVTEKDDSVSGSRNASMKPRIRAVGDGFTFFRTEKGNNHQRNKDKEQISYKEGQRRINGQKSAPSTARGGEKKSAKPALEAREIFRCCPKTKEKKEKKLQAPTAGEKGRRQCDTSSATGGREQRVTLP